MAFTWTTTISDTTTIKKDVISELVEKANTAAGYASGMSDVGNNITLTASDTPSSKDLILLYKKIDNIHSLGINCSTNNTSNLTTVNSSQYGTVNSSHLSPNNSAQCGTVNTSQCYTNNSSEDDANEWSEYSEDQCSVDYSEHYGKECWNCDTDTNTIG